MPCSLCGLNGHNITTCGKEKIYNFRIDSNCEWIEYRGKQYRFNKEYDFEDEIEYVSGMYSDNVYLTVHYSPDKHFIVYKQAILNPIFIYAKEELNILKLDTKFVKILSKYVSFEIV